MDKYTNLAYSIWRKINKKKDISIYSTTVYTALLSVMLKKYFDQVDYKKEDCDVMIKITKKGTEVVEVSIFDKTIKIADLNGSIVGYDENNKQVAKILTTFEEGFANTVGEIIVGDDTYLYKVNGQSGDYARSFEVKATNNGETKYHGEFEAFGAKINHYTEIFEFNIFDNETGERISDRTSFLKKLVDSLKGMTYPDSVVSVPTDRSTSQLFYVSDILESLESKLNVYYQTKDKNKTLERK